MGQVLVFVDLVAVESLEFAICVLLDPLVIDLLNHPIFKSGYFDYQLLFGFVSILEAHLSCSQLIDQLVILGHGFRKFIAPFCQLLLKILHSMVVTGQGCSYLLTFLQFLLVFLNYLQLLCGTVLYPLFVLILNLFIA